MLKGSQLDVGQGMYIMFRLIGHEVDVDINQLGVEKVIVDHSLQRILIAK